MPGIGVHILTTCFFYKAYKNTCLFPVTRLSLGNGPDPRLFFKKHIPPKKHCFNNFKPFFLRIFLLWQKKKRKKSRPTYPNLFGHVTGNKHLFFRPNVKRPKCRTFLALTCPKTFHKMY